MSDVYIPVSIPGLHVPAVAHIYIISFVVLFTTSTILPAFQYCACYWCWCYTSFTSSKIHENGNRIIDNKYMTNNNGKVDSKHTITEKDKKCNDIIKNVII